MRTEQDDYVQRGHGAEEAWQAGALQCLAPRLEFLKPAPSRSSVHHRLAPVLDLWGAAEKPEGLLQKSDIDPLLLPVASWKYLIVLERKADDQDCRVRLFGTHLCKQLDLDATHMSVSDLLGGTYGRRILQEVSRTLETSRAPVHFRLNLVFRCFDILVTAVFLPVGGETGKLSGAFGGVICEHRGTDRSQTG